MQLFKKGVVVLDEVDLILHPLKSELNFPTGEKYDLDFSPLRWNFAIHLLDAFLFGENGRISFCFEESDLAKSTLTVLNKKIEEGYQKRALQRSPHLVLLNEDYYHSVLKPTAAEWAYHWLQKNHFIGLENSEVINFLCNGASSSNNPELAAKLNNPVRVEPKHVQMMTLAREWISSYLPHCLMKINRVSFGVLSAEDHSRALQSDPVILLTHASGHSVD